MRPTRRLAAALLGAVLTLPTGAALADLAAGHDAYDRGDYIGAIREYKPLAQAGDAEAQYWLGVMLMEGTGIEANPEAALRFLRESADQNNAEAQSYLGWVYETGNGLEADEEQALSYYRLAAAQGSLYAQTAAANLLLARTDDPAAIAEAVELLNEAKDQGDTWALGRLGILYSDGVGVPRDPAEAERLLRAAIQLGSTDAMNSLAWLFATQGTGSLDEAFTLAKRALAADPESAAILDTLGWIEFKRGNIDWAIRYIKRATENWPEYGPMHDRLGDAYAADGQTALAREEWQKAVDLTTPDEVAEPGWDRNAVLVKLGLEPTADTTGGDDALQDALNQALLDWLHSPGAIDDAPFPPEHADAFGACAAQVLAVLSDADKQLLIDATDFEAAADALQQRLRQEDPALNDRIGDGMDDCMQPPAP